MSFLIKNFKETDIALYYKQLHTSFFLMQKWTFLKSIFRGWRNRGGIVWFMRFMRLMGRAGADGRRVKKKKLQQKKIKTDKFMMSWNLLLNLHWKSGPTARRLASGKIWLLATTKKNAKIAFYVSDIRKISKSRAPEFPVTRFFIEFILYIIMCKK